MAEKNSLENFDNRGYANLFEIIGDYYRNNSKWEEAHSALKLSMIFYKDGGLLEKAKSLDGVVRRMSDLAYGSML